MANLLNLKSVRYQNLQVSDNFFSWNPKIKIWPILADIGQYQPISKFADIGLREVNKLGSVYIFFLLSIWT